MKKKHSLRLFYCQFYHFGITEEALISVMLTVNGSKSYHTANFSVVIFTTASRDNILRCSPDVEFTSGSPTQLRDVIWIKYICTTTEEM